MSWRRSCFGGSDRATAPALNFNNPAKIGVPGLRALYPLPNSKSKDARQVRLFRNGRNQAVRIPRKLELPGNEALLDEFAKMATQQGPTP